MLAPTAGGGLGARVGKQAGPRKPPLRRRTWVWWPLAALSVLPPAALGFVVLLGIATVVGPGMDDDPGEPVPCTEAMAFADLPGLPEGARDAECEAYIWLDTSYYARFLIGRDAFDAWLASVYPGVGLGPDACFGESDGRCAGFGLDPVAEGGAARIGLDVRDRPGNTLWVIFGAHSRP
ncbi:hypothetical protein [Streptomyces aidingensis]|uniref:Uncharacterized protein n=1 Tax=Streptomyces aidingensis TaxID=910347 RepID=A0A1I1SFG6_9ACTN|nr:hypothetical protein [Streptomyces aidingensis]SFD45191.1 hypothetical protein SAMN05421773_1167 [Streptomyces aidingensis]